MKAQSQTSRLRNFLRKLLLDYLLPCIIIVIIFKLTQLFWSPSIKIESTNAWLQRMLKICCNTTRQWANITTQWRRR